MANSPLDRIASNGPLAVMTRSKQTAEGSRLDAFRATLSEQTREGRAQAAANLCGETASIPEAPIDQPAAMLAKTVAQSAAPELDTSMYGIGVSSTFEGNQRTVSSEEAATMNTQYAQGFDAFKSSAKSQWDRYVAEGGNTDSLDSFGASLQAMNGMTYQDFITQALGPRGFAEMSNPVVINGYDQNAIAVQQAAMTVKATGPTDATLTSAAVYGVGITILAALGGSQRTVSANEAAEINSQYAQGFEAFKSNAKSGWDRYVAEGGNTKNLDAFGASCKSFLEMTYQDFMVLALGPKGFGEMKNPEVINGYNQKAVTDYAYSVGKGLGDQFKAATHWV